MSSNDEPPLDWRWLDKGDRVLRQEFSCANPPRVNYVTGHPRRWELEPQKLLRSHVCQRGQALLGGLDELGIAAMSLWDASVVDDVDLYAVGVANRWRRKGGDAARALMKRTTERIAANAHAAQVSQLVVNARVHRSNEASQHLCTEFGFECVEPVPNSPYELWRRQIVVREELGYTALAEAQDEEDRAYGEAMRRRRRSTDEP